MIRLSWFTRMLICSLALALLFAAALPASPAQASACRASISVRPGDTLGAIAQKFNVAIKDLTSANRLYAPSYTIYVGQKLCIPAEAGALAGVPAYANALAADFSARNSGGALEIKTSNFPKNNSYYVKVSGGGAQNEKIGLLNTGAGGTKLLKLALEANLAKAAKLTVCLKNNMTDANICRTAKK